MTDTQQPNVEDSFWIMVAKRAQAKIDAARLSRNVAERTEETMGALSSSPSPSTGAGRAGVSG